MPAQTVRVTLACNHGCVFCFAGWSPSEAQPRRGAHDWTNLIGADWRRELDEVRASGYDELSISGGEPLLHPAILDMVRHAKSLGFRRIEVQTNASLLTEANLSRLVNAGMTSSMASLPAHEEKQFNAITRTRGHYASVLAGLKNLVRARVELTLCHVICAANYRRLVSFVDFAHRELPGSYEVLFFYAQPEGRAAANVRLLPRLDRLSPYWQAAVQQADGLRLRFRVDTQTGLPLCFLRGFEDRLKMQDLLDPRSVFGDDLGSFEYMQARKRKAKACSQCFFDPVCFGFWKAYLDAHGDDELRPVAADERLKSMFPEIQARRAFAGAGA